MRPDDQPDIKYPHVHVALVGENRSIFNLLGRVVAALQAGGVPQDEIDAFFHDASAGDSDHALATVACTVQVRTVDEMFQLADELANNGSKYTPDLRMGTCVTCAKVLSPDDILTITSTWRETGNCDGCPRLELPEPFESIYHDIVGAAVSLTNDGHEGRCIADRVMPILSKAVKGGLQELVESTMFWRDVLEHFDEDGLDGDKSILARAAVVGFHAGFTSAHERLFTEALNLLVEEGHAAYGPDGEVRLTEKGWTYAENARKPC